MTQYLVTRSFPGHFVGQFVSLSDADAEAQRFNVAARVPFVASPPPAPTVAEALSALSTMAQAREAAGILFQAQAAATASLLPTDAASQGKLLSAFVAAGAGLWIDGTPWKMADGATFVPFTRADAEAAAGFALAYVAGCATAEARIAALVSADPALDIATPALWPSQGPFATPRVAADAVAFDPTRAVAMPTARADRVAFDASHAVPFTH